MEYQPPHPSCAQPLKNLNHKSTFSQPKERQPNPEKKIDRQTAICQLAKLKDLPPEATTLVDMKTNNVFAEPGT